MFFYFLTYLFNVFAVLSSLIMIWSQSPVRLVFSLISIFFFTTLVFLQLNVHFATLVLLLVYLGAVIVMFLILVMFINVRVYKTSNNQTFLLQLYISTSILLILFLLTENVFHLDFAFYFIKWFLLYDNLEMISAICLHLFSLLSLEIFLVVFILLIAMVSSMAIVFIEMQNLWKNTSANKKVVL